MERSTLRGLAKRVIAWLVALAVVLVAVGVVYVGTPLHGTTASIEAVERNPSVTVTQRPEAVVLEPTGATAATGLVFYPGGRIHPDAYIASLAPLAGEADVRVVVPRMRLNLAVFDQGAASPYIDGERDWYVGGHSLGGVMACRYARANPARVEGVVLFASYCDRDITETGLAVLSVTGRADTVLDGDAYERNLDNLPATAMVRELPLNHSQFGSYRGQTGDEPSGISYPTAHERLADLLLSWFRTRS